MILNTCGITEDTLMKDQFDLSVLNGVHQFVLSKDVPIFVDSEAQWCVALGFVCRFSLASLARILERYFLDSHLIQPSHLRIHLA